MYCLIQPQKQMNLKHLLSVENLDQIEFNCCHDLELKIHVSLRSSDDHACEMPIN